MLVCLMLKKLKRVALRKESVDRNNCLYNIRTSVVNVALRKESVDRNLWWGVRKAVGSLVALRKESVDRNSADRATNDEVMKSLSARRAWIEIEFTQLYSALSHVALRKESVDRNL